jgi:flagellar hook-associated protein 2
VSSVSSSTTAASTAGTAGLSTVTAADGTPLQTISGLASGLDTSSIISALMQVAEQPENQLKNQITVETARQTAYQAVETELQNLTTSYEALTDVTTWAPTQSLASSDSTSVSATLTGGAAAGAYTVAVTQLARANQYTASGPSSAAANDTIHLTTSAGTTNVAVSAGDSLATIAAKINQTAGSPAYATIFNGSLVLSNKQTGTANAVTVTNDGGSGLSFAQTQTALDAQLSVNGTPYTSGSNTVTNVLPGVTLTLGAQTASTTITIGSPTANTANIETALTNFVTEYNSVLTDLQSRLSEQPVANASTPDDLAKGVLYNDQGLERLVSQLRNSFSDLMQNGGQYTSLAQVGLSTGAAVGDGPLSQDSINGMLTVDTTTLETALNTNFDAVKSLFTNSTNNYSTEGLGQRLDGILQQYTNPSALGGYLSTEIDNETSTISDLQSQVADWDQRLALKQQMYQQEFTNMETALSQAQSIGSQLSSQISQLG